MKGWLGQSVGWLGESERRRAVPQGIALLGHRWRYAPATQPAGALPPPTCYLFLSSVLSVSPW
jgi:hypothetical protein